MKKKGNFCLMTVGRTGSTSLMHSLYQFRDIAMPSKNIDCLFEELLHPNFIETYKIKYSSICGNTITTSAQLIESFYKFNKKFTYRGFKSMPGRHLEYKEFIDREDIQFISLYRKDIFSTVASFWVAMKVASWARTGEQVESSYRFDAKLDGPFIIKNIGYLASNYQRLNFIPKPIWIAYEDLCSPEFCSPELNEFFARQIQLINPNPPTNAIDYIENWDEFKSFVQLTWRSQSINVDFPLNISSID